MGRCNTNDDKRIPMTSQQRVAKTLRTHSAEGAWRRSQQNLAGFRDAKKPAVHKNCGQPKKLPKK
jgi:hypothetical protein